MKRKIIAPIAAVALASAVAWITFNAIPTVIAEDTGQPSASNLVERVDELERRIAAMEKTIEALKGHSITEPLGLSEKSLVGTWLASWQTGKTELRFEAGGTFHIVATNPGIAAQGRGTWRIEGDRVLATYSYDGQDEIVTELPLSYVAPWTLCYLDIKYHKQGVATHVRNQDK